jgi:DNA-directed RNA polymerase specialized sigma subunit
MKKKQSSSTTEGSAGELSTEATPAHYVDNKKFLQALIDYKNAVELAKKEGREKPQVTNYIGECFLKIATHLSYKTNFINYTFKDDMISDGIENCLSAADKFDPEKSSNPFAYYTQIVFFAFVRRIQKEKKQQQTKYKLIENMDIDSIITQEQDSGEFTNQFIDYLKRQVDIMEMDKKVVILPTAKPKIEDSNSLEFDDR